MGFETHGDVHLTEAMQQVSLGVPDCHVMVWDTKAKLASCTQALRTRTEGLGTRLGLCVFVRVGSWSTVLW